MIIKNRILKILFTLILGVVSIAISYAQEGSVEYIDTTDCGDTIPDAQFIARDIAGGGILQKLFFTNDTNSNFTYQWDLGNSDTPTGYVNIITTYNKDSYYTVSLTETNTTKTKCIVKRSRRIRNLLTAPYPGGKIIYAYLEKGCNSLTTSFNYIPTAFNDWPTLEWHFGDGDTSTGYNPVHTYKNVGIYYPYVFFNGIYSDSAQLLNTRIEVTQAPDAHFIYLQKKDTADIRGSFETIFVGKDQLYKDTTYHFTWNPLGDSSDIARNSYMSITAVSKPSNYYIYPDSGNYNPSLFVYYNYGVNNDVCGSLFDTTLSVHDDLANNIIVPNVVFLSQNNSTLGYNHFGITSNGKTVLTLKVYSRSGTLIYEETSINIEWDCRTPNGELLNSGIYYYTLFDNKGGEVKSADYFHVFRNDNK